MELFDAVQKRRSVRKFLEVPLPWEPVAHIIEAGRLAPSAGNVQDCRFVVILDAESRHKIAEACYQQYWMTKAPVHIVIGVDPTKNEQFYGKRGVERYTFHDAAAAAMSMLLAAEAQGIGACWVGAFDDDQLRHASGMPDNIQPHVVIPLGYPDEAPAEQLRFEIQEVIFFNKWGNKYLYEIDLSGEYSKLVAAAAEGAKLIVEKAKRHLKKV